MAASVFISYARKDGSEHAERLQRDLEARGHRVWRDVRDIDHSIAFMVDLQRAIDAHAYLVLLVSADVLRPNSFVHNETAYADNHGKTILVARIEDVEPPLNVYARTWINFFSGYDHAFQRLCQALEGREIATDRTSPLPAADPFHDYVKRLHDIASHDLNESILTKDVIPLTTIASPGDVPAHTDALTPRLTLIPYSIKTPKPVAVDVETPSQEFPSLRDAYAHAHCDGRVLLLGEPGAGKTTTLLAFARDAAAARLSDPSQPLPLFARISGWDSQAQTPLHEWLAAMHNLDAGALRGLIDDGKALLLLDGLDELGSRRPVDPKKPDGEQYDPRERFLQMLPTTAKVILSSRVEEYRQIGARAELSCAVRLERLDDAQMQAYLADVAGLWEVVSADADLKDALRTPLLLALVRVAYEDAPEAARALGGLSVGDLNDRIWDAFIDKRWQHEQARTPDAPLPYSAAELKQRLGAALMIGAFNRFDHTRIVAADVSGKDREQLITLGKRLDLVREDSDTPIAIWRFLHLRLSDALAFQAAILALDNDNRRVRRSAAGALGKLADARAVDPLIAALGDVDWNVSERAAESLGQLGDPRAVKPLIALLRDSNEFVRSRAAESLGQLDDPRAVAPLIEVLRGEDEMVRWSAASALGELSDARAVEPLITLLHDPNEMVRSSVVSALGKLGDVRAIEPLIDALRDHSEPVYHDDDEVLYPGDDFVMALRQFPEHPAARAAIANYEAGNLKPRRK